MAREINNAWLVQEREPGGDWTTTVWIPMAEVTHANGNELMAENRWDIGEAQAALHVHKNKLSAPNNEHRYIADHHHAAPPSEQTRTYVAQTYGTWQS